MRFSIPTLIFSIVWRDVKLSSFFQFKLFHERLYFRAYGWGVYLQSFVRVGIKEKKYVLPKNFCIYQAENIFTGGLRGDRERKSSRQSQEQAGAGQPGDGRSGDWPGEGASHAAVCNVDDDAYLQHIHASIQWEMTSISFTAQQLRAISQLFSVDRKSASSLPTRRTSVTTSKTPPVPTVPVCRRRLGRHSVELNPEISCRRRSGSRARRSPNWSTGTGWKRCIRR